MGQKLWLQRRNKKMGLNKRDNNAKVDVRIDTQNLEHTLMRDNEGCAGFYKITEIMSNW